MHVDYLHQFLFGYYPYLALLVFVIGTILRYDVDQYNWKAGSSQLLRGRGMRLGSNFFHVGIILLFFGHLFGLLTPTSFYSFLMTPSFKQYMAMILGGIFGLMCLFGASILLYRRLTDARIRSTSKPSDILVLVILYIQLVLGLISIFFSAQHPDGSSMVMLANWAQHIVTFRSGAAQFIVPQAMIFKLHLVLGLTIFLIFPFTRLVHALSVPVKYFFRSGYQIVRRRA